LVRAFEVPRAAAAGVAQRVLTSLPSPSAAANVTDKPRRSQFLSLALAMAIGFLLAVVIFRPWKSPTNPQMAGKDERLTAMPADPSIARLVVATKTDGVEVIDRKSKNWQPVAEISQFQCPTEGSVRTDAGSRCEIVTSEGCVVRMNSGTEIVVHSPARI